MYMVKTEKPQMAIMYFHLDLLVKSGSSSQDRCLREVEGTMETHPLGRLPIEKRKQATSKPM